MSAFRVVKDGEGNPDLEGTKQEIKATAMLISTYARELGPTITECVKEVAPVIAPMFIEAVKPIVEVARPYVQEQAVLDRPFEADQIDFLISAVVKSVIRTLREEGVLVSKTE
jgi:hypothetical protein